MALKAVIHGLNILAERMSGFAKRKGLNQRLKS